MNQLGKSKNTSTFFIHLKYIFKAVTRNLGKTLNKLYFQNELRIDDSVGDPFVGWWSLSINATEIGQTMEQMSFEPKHWLFGQKAKFWWDSRVKTPGMKQL